MRLLSAVFLSLYMLLPSIVLSETLALDDCIGYTLKNNPQVKIAEQKVVAARGRRNEAFSGYLPHINAAATYTKLSQAPFEVSPQMAALFGGSINPSFFSEQLYAGRLTLTQPLFMWGKIYQFNKQARLAYELSVEDLRKTKHELTLSVKQAFYGYLLARQMSAISLEAASIAEEHHRVSKVLYDDGRLSSYDVSQVKVAMANAKSNAVRAKNGSDLARAALVNLLNITAPAGENFEFEGELAFVPVDVKLEKAKNDALIYRPEIKQMDLTEGIMKSMVSVSKSENKPNIAAVGNYTAQYGMWDTDPDKWDKRWDATIALTLPLFDGFSTCAKIKQSKAALEEVKQTKEQLKKGIELEIEQAYLILEQNKNIIDAQKENMETALQNLQIAKKRYAEGIMSSLEIRDAQLAATMAETNYYQSLTEYLIAAAKLEKATGK